MSQKMGLWLLAGAVGGALLVPSVVMMALGLLGIPHDPELLSMVFAVLAPAAALGVYGTIRLKSSLWLALHRLPRDKEAMLAVAALRPRWRDPHAALTLAARRYAYRRADGGHQAYLATHWVAQAYGEAGGSSPDELFKLMRAWHMRLEMDATGAAIAKVVGLKNTVAALREGTPVDTMVMHIDRFGVKAVEDGLAAGIPFEYMEAMK